MTLQDHYDMMGMNVAAFTLFDADKVREHQLTYTGTQDNQTVKGRYAALDRGTKAQDGKVLTGFGSWGVYSNGCGKLRQGIRQSPVYIYGGQNANKKIDD